MAFSRDSALRCGGQSIGIYFLRRVLNILPLDRTGISAPAQPA
jgi:hypothetical protein